MKSRPTQFGVRKNPDSPGVHGLRLSVDSSSLRSESQTRNSLEVTPSSPRFPAAERLDMPLARATGGEAKKEMQDRGQLLTVQEVANLLHVPVSWVYEQTRRRGTGQLPHLKLGKYLRFEESTVTEFIRERRRA